jgi:hypothetical protein
MTTAKTPKTITKNQQHKNKNKVAQLIHDTNHDKTTNINIKSD